MTITTTVTINNFEAVCLLEQGLFSIKLFIVQLLAALILIKVEGKPQTH